MTTVAREGLIDCPMLQTVSGRPTDYWNDSCAIDELRYAVERGATGATSNPSIVLEVLAKERAYWAAAHPRARPESPIADRVRPDLGARRGDGRPWRGDPRAGVRAGGRAQGPAVDPDQPGELPEHGAHARAGAPLRDPRSEHAGEVPGHRGRASRRSRRRPARGVSVNATVCFTVPQAIAVAEAIERGLDAFEAGGGDVVAMSRPCARS